jgi:hypothetical protein
MTTGEIQYLKEVLGIKSYVVAELADVEAVSLEPQPLQQPAPAVSEPKPAQAVLEFIVYSPFALDQNEAAIVDRMIGAIGATRALSLNQQQHSGEEIKAEALKAGVRVGLSFGLEAPAETGLQWALMPAVSRFLDDSNPAQRDQAKRIAWDKLKKLKSEGVSV